MALRLGQIVRIIGNGYIRRILDIRNGEALTVGADDIIGYIELNKLESVSQEEIDKYKSEVEGRE